MSQARARTFLKKKHMDDLRDLKEQWQELQEENLEAQNKAGIGGLLGSIGLPLLASLFAGPAGLPIWAGMATSAIGQRAGSEAGEHHKGDLFSFDFSGEGVQGAEAITPVGSGADYRMDLQTAADETYGQWDSQQNMDALNTAISAYPLLGGNLNPGSIGGLFSKKGLGAPSSLNLGKTLFSQFS